MNQKKKRILCLVMFLMIIVQIIAINSMASIYGKFKYNEELSKEIKTDSNEVLISELVRGQQRNMLSSLKQSWIKYIDTNPNNDLIIEDENCNPIYSNDNVSIGFNKDTMIKVQIENLKEYDIYSRSSNELLASNVKPKWDSEKVEEVLDILVAPNKLFGNNGGLIVYDSNSGEIFLDTTPEQRISNGKKASMFDDHKNKDNKNTNESLIAIQNHFIPKRDSSILSNIVYQFNEPTEMGKNAADFHKYPLGKYNRQFIEMSVMPYETIGFNGQPMQLTILSVVAEKDIYAVFSQFEEKSEKLNMYNVRLYNTSAIILLFSLFATMTIMIIGLYILKYKFNDEK